MARQKSPNRDKAFEIYKKHNGDIKLIDIAKQLDVSDVQIRKWKNQDKWDDILKGTLPKGNSNVTNQKVTKRKGTEKEKEVSEKQIEAVLKNDELTDKQKLFCIYYIEDFIATKAYRKAYNADYETARVNGSRLLTNANIKLEIDRLTEECLKEKEISSKMLAKRVFQKYIDIAFSNITDFVEFGQEEIKNTDAETGEEISYIRNHVYFKNDYEVDGTIISEVSQGKDGVKIKLQDKMKALEFLAKNIGLLDIETQSKLKNEEEKIKMAKEKLEFEKLKLNGNDNVKDREGISDFIKATTMNEEEIKELFKDDEENEQE